MHVKTRAGYLCRASLILLPFYHSGIKRQRQAREQEIEKRRRTKVIGIPLTPKKELASEINLQERSFQSSAQQSPLTISRHRNSMKTGVGTIIVVEQETGWDKLPEWTALDFDNASKYIVDLRNYSCTCPDWLEKRSSAPERNVRRCCKHVLAAIRSRRSAINDWNTWLYRVINVFTARAVPSDFEHILCSNGESKFLVLYVKDTGYLRLVGPDRSSGQDFQYGLQLWSPDSPREEWAQDYKPKNAVGLKKNIRPWAKALDRLYADRQKAFRETRNQ